MRIWVRDLFDLDPGWKNSGPGSGLNIPDRNIGVNEWWSGLGGYRYGTDLAPVWKFPPVSCTCLAQ